MNVERIFAIGVCVAVLAGVVVAFVVIGPPAHARNIALDARRLDDLGQIATRLHDRYGKPNARLPDRLPNDLVSSYLDGTPTDDDSDTRNYADDPESGRPYTYRRINARRYLLCAVFALPDEHSGETVGDSVRSPWGHGAGRICYTLEASSSVYCCAYRDEIASLRRHLLDRVLHRLVSIGEPLSGDQSRELQAAAERRGLRLCQFAELIRATTKGRADQLDALTEIEAMALLLRWDQQA